MTTLDDYKMQVNAIFYCGGCGAENKVTCDLTCRPDGETSYFKAKSHKVICKECDRTIDLRGTDLWE